MLRSTDRVRIEQAATARERTFADPALNRLEPADRPAHSWYRFVLSFPPHLVRQYIADFALRPGVVLLDPFCGTGTTVVEAKRRGLAGVGIEANALAAFACTVKVDWDLSGANVERFAARVVEAAERCLNEDGVPDVPGTSPGPTRTRLRSLPADALKLLLANSISERPLHKALVLREEIERLGKLRADGHARLAFARTLVESASNLHFGPEVGVGPKKADAAVIEPWARAMSEIAADLRELASIDSLPATIHRADARDAGALLAPRSIDAVITSPPYPNEKDYTRTTRLESVMLGFLSNKHDLRAMKKGLVRSNTRTVYRLDDDDRFIKDHPKIHALADQIEARRIEMGKTSGFERMYHKVTRLYFGGMARHLAGLRPALKPGAMLAYVVGDQASYLRVMIRTGELLAEIAESLGYQVVRIDLFRTRLATATKEQLREECVILRWPR